MPRYPYASRVSYTFGPGPLTPAIKALIWVNVGMFVVPLLLPEMSWYLALVPAAVIERLYIWQPVTYMFLHAGVFHILFNMLMLWMFGTDLERTWGSRFFVQYYFVTGIGAAAATILVSLVPSGLSDVLYLTPTVGASGAIYGVLVAYGLSFPDRPIYLYLLFPIPARVFVLIMGAIELLSSISGGHSNIAYSAHLGGLVVGYLYLKLRRGNLLPEIKYRMAKVRMDRARGKFDVHRGGRRDGGNGRVH
jgi:membrane associated rhomboid family serine protease